MHKKKIYKKFLNDDVNYRNIVKKTCNQGYIDFTENVHAMENKYCDFPMNKLFAHKPNDRIFSILQLRLKTWTSICTFLLMSCDEIKKIKNKEYRFLVTWRLNTYINIYMCICLVEH